MSIIGLETALEKIETLVDEKTINAAVDAAAEQYKTDILDWIDAGESFVSRTGTLRSSITDSFGGNETAEVIAGAWYAPQIEFGTPQHSKAYPFFFADMQNREINILNIMAETLHNAVNQ